jgi:uncharacterized protein (DUF1330 family)
MSVYMIVEITVKDSELYSKYVDQVREIVEKHEGRYLARGGQVTPLSGNWNPERIILIEFETDEQLQKCFESREYLEIAPLREQSTISKSIVVEGCAPPKRAAE